MASPTRFYLNEAFALPGLVVAPDSDWEVTSAPADIRWMHVAKKTNGDTLATTAGFTSTVNQDRQHRQFISLPMKAGITFDTSTTYKAQIQMLESAAGDNAFSVSCVRIVSQDGKIVRHTPLPLADYSTAAEINTALRNKTIINGDAGIGSYVTERGDRLLFEVGHRATASASVSSRYGSSGAGADLGENETDTGTTLNPWFETSADISFIEWEETFEAAGPDGTAVNGASTIFMTTTNTPVSDDTQAPPEGLFWCLVDAVAQTKQMRVDWVADSSGFFRFYFRMDTTPPATNLLLNVRSGASVCAQLQITTAGNLQLRDQTQTQIDLSAAALAADTDYRIEGHITTARWECRIFSGANLHGNTADEAENTLGGAISITTFDNISIGVGTVATWRIWLDAIKFKQDGWAGPKILSSRPYPPVRRFAPLLVR